MEEQQIISKKGPSCIQYDCDSLIKFAKSKGGSISMPHADEYVVSKNVLIAVCSQGHTWSVTPNYVNKWCTICSIIDGSSRAGSIVTCEQTKYTYGQANFECMCTQGHRSMMNTGAAKLGCGTCKLQASINPNIKIDVMCINNHRESRFRCYCNECGQEFYADTKQFKKSSSPVYSCAKHHYDWGYKFGVIVSIRTIEILCDARFDDSPPRGIEVTGYCANLKIAFTHLVDNYAVSYVQTALKWCNDNDIKFILIPLNKIDGSAVADYIVIQLIGHGDLGITDKNYREKVTTVRNTKKRMENNNTFYVNRCVFTRDQI